MYTCCRIRHERAIKGIFVNMPFRYINRYMEYILSDCMYVEIGIQADDLDSVSIDVFSDLASMLHYREILFTLHGPFWDLCPGSIDSLIRQVYYLRMSQFMDVARAMSPLQVVIHTGYDPRHHRPHVDEWIDRAMSVMEPIIRRAEDGDFNIVIENVWEEDPSIHKKIFEILKSPCLGFCLDTGHQNCFSRAPLSMWLNELHPFLKEIHIHDNDGSHDVHAPPGLGTVDFPMLFSFLNEKMCYPVLTMEPHTDEDFVNALEALRRIIPKAYCESYRKRLAQISGKS